jgi:long-chain-fatty-acid--[acyl-carrier-protein] ligase
MLLLRYGLWLLTRLVLPLRYRIECFGDTNWRELPRPVLILPNHPGYVDPIIMITLLWPSLRPRPLLWEGMFLNPWLYPSLGMIRAVRIPDLSQASPEARAQAEQAIDQVIGGLRQGENYLLWPAGHAEHDGRERLGGARATADILRAVPNATVLLARTRGVWGSSLSYAYTGQSPPLGKRLLRGFGFLLANLLFFMPRRRVQITFERIDRARLPELRRETLNPWLEKWYSPDGSETPTFVPYHFLFGPRTYDFPQVASPDEVDLSRIKPETKQAVAEILSQKLGRPLAKEEQEPNVALEQLGLDSLDGMELTVLVEKRFGKTNGLVPENVGQLWAMAEGLAHTEPPKPPPPAWFKPLSMSGAVEPLGQTIIHAFVNRALAQRRDVIVADDRAGPITYERLLVGTRIMARRFANLPSANVGLLMPASVAADVSFMALLMAGKLPVLLNWTTGPAHLAHAAQLMKLTHVITSRAFIDRTEIEVAGVEYLYLEDLRKEVGRLELLTTLLQVRYLPGLIRRMIPSIDPAKPALILFTSGSERAPKAVPLTHVNILTEMRAAVTFVGLTHSEVLLGFLPPFHSFGIAACILLPLLGGMRVVHHPDPTDAGALARKITAYKVTMLVGTPTFISFIFERSKPGDLDSLRLIVVGAEKCPKSLYDRARQLAPHAEVMEGYGVTECSPVVAVNRPGATRPGTVGQPLPGVEVIAVDLESEQPVPRGQTGMLWVTGPTIFPGYLGFDGPPPFREKDGKRWYVTGDLAEIDADGYIRLAGRLSRFLKAGGEMISLPALEEPFTRRFPPTDEGPRVAVEGIETDNGRHIVLFTTESPALSEANALLQQEGFRGVMRLDEVRHVPRLPLLGTGKVDYKVLRAQLTSDSSVKSH